MKRIGNLYEQIISMENLRLADERARRGKLRSYGVRRHDAHREEELERLHELLRTKTYRTSEYDVFKVYRPKERVIYRLPYYPDRIVHHAVMNVLEPIWVSVFTHNTYSCIKGRGITGCARRVRKIIDGYAGRPLYCLKLDVRKFYPSIDHDVMKDIVRKKIKDKDLLWLLDEIIDSAKGLPIGNYLSQFLANLYLAYLMHYVNEELRVDATEYADDICVFSDSKERLRDVLDKVRGYLRGLRLEVKGDYQIFPIATDRYSRDGRALDYVGYLFYREHTWLRKSIKKRMCRRAARLNSRGVSVERYRSKMASWLGWAKHCDSRHLLSTIISKDYEGLL